MAGVMLGLCVNGFLDGGASAPRVTRPQHSNVAPVTKAPIARMNSRKDKTIDRIEH
jgi:hypothetical protein